MVRIERFNSAPEVRIDYEHTPVPEHLRDQVELAWNTLTRSNPNYFNGEMLAFMSFDPSDGVIHARAEQYKHHAVRDQIHLGVRMLAVTGLIVAPDHEGVPHYLLGKRSSKTHRYGDLWEFGPCGGIDVPEVSIDTLTFDMIREELCRESLEEVGMSLESAPMSALALVHDDHVGSTDIVLRVELSTLPELSTEWEYEDLRWITKEALLEWIDREQQAFIPTAIEIAGLL
jgi:hypothetical protein